MNGTNGNEPGYPENALVPYPVIVAATKLTLDNDTFENTRKSRFFERRTSKVLY